jgi:hypothetical protein
VTTLRPGWYDSTDIADDSLRASRRYLDAEGYARIQTTGVTGLVEMSVLEPMLVESMERVDARLIAEGCTLVDGVWPEGTKFDPIPEGLFR